MKPSLALLLSLVACNGASPSTGSADSGAAPDGSLACPVDRAACGSSCVDLTSDAAHCGRCDNACGWDEQCSAGACGVPDCRQTGCSTGSWCNPSSARCEPGCSGSTGCSPLEACDTASHSCVCRSGYKRCASGACIADTGPCPPPACATDRTLCSGQCVDTWTDPRHCGGCGQPCQPGEICRGTCQPGPDCRQTACEGLTWCDPLNGICKPGCLAATQCDRSETCDLITHSCACPRGTHPCSGVCVSDTSPATCGGRCAECPSAPNGAATCAAGQCSISCLPAYHDCGGTCAADSAASSCGTRCQACPGDPNGSATCDGTSCGLSCRAGFHLCNGSCASDSSTSSCGTLCAPCPTRSLGTPTCNGASCGITCNGGSLLCSGACAACPGNPAGSIYSCAGADCVASSCRPGYHLCGGACVSNGSPQTCGSSCSACPGIANGTATCNGASCDLACNPGFRMCNGACAACPGGTGIGTTTCSGTQCVIGSCAAGFHLCTDACLSNTSTSSCGSACSPCPGPANGYATCNGASCGISCFGGYQQCGSGCSQCPSGAGVLGTACSGDACVPSACAAGYFDCGLDGCCTWNRERIRTYYSYLGGTVVVDAAGTAYGAACDTPASDLASGRAYYGVRPAGGAWTWTLVGTNCGKMIIRRDSTGRIRLVREEAWTTSPAPQAYQGDWNSAGVTWTPIGQGRACSFELDSSDQPWVTCESGSSVWMAHATAGAWSSEPVCSSCRSASLAVAPGDVPTVLYLETTGWNLVLASRTSTGLQLETVPNSYAADYTKLAFAGPWPATPAHFTADNALHVLRKTASGWVNDTLASGYCSTCRGANAFGADPFGRLRIAYFGPGSTGGQWSELRGSAWATQSFSLGGSLGGLTFSPRGHPFVLETNPSSSAGSELWLSH